MIATWQWLKKTGTLVDQPETGIRKMVQHNATNDELEKKLDEMIQWFDEAEEMQ